MRSLILGLALTAAACGPATEARSIPEYGYQVLRAYPHDPDAFTEGLLYLNGYLYESTGIKGESSVRKVRLETGEVLEQHDVPDDYFGEGIVNWGDHLIQLTWDTQKGFVYDLATFETRSEFTYPGEGWALTHDGRRIIMSDGTSELRFWSPESLKESGRIQVTAGGQPVERLNELEWVKGEIYANIWQTDRIARIDPSSGVVVGWIDLTGLPIEGKSENNCLNGIAYDAKDDRLFVTGKRWPKLFEIKLVPKTAR